MASFAFPFGQTLLTPKPNRNLVAPPPILRASFTTITIFPSSATHFPPKAPHFQLHFSHRPSDDHAISRKTHSSLATLILLAFSFALLSLRLVSGVLLPDFPDRWAQLIAFSERAHSEVMVHCPQDLVRAVVAYEDRRFFSHFGVDPIGVARAVLSFSARGGGSTITQQLVRNTLLRNERTFLRKIVEMVLALAVERTLSKLTILSSYLCKIYWGHGIYGVQSASNFYFGKHISILSLGECAMLAAMIPGPEIRSPFRDSSRGKIFQARVVRRMVEVGFLDVKLALMVVKQSLELNSESHDYSEALVVPLPSHKVQALVNINSEAGTLSNFRKIWNWERESKIWEVKEDMERWAMSVTEKSRINYK
nr:penicillin-binding protein 1A-like [Ipomoea batatas]